MAKGHANLAREQRCSSSYGRRRRSIGSTERLPFGNREEESTRGTEKYEEVWMAQNNKDKKLLVHSFALKANITTIARKFDSSLYPLYIYIYIVQIICTDNIR